MTHQEFLFILSTLDYRLTDFLKRHTRHIEPLAPGDVQRIKLDWEAQRWKTPRTQIDNQSMISVLARSPLFSMPAGNPAHGERRPLDIPELDESDHAYDRSTESTPARMPRIRWRTLKFFMVDVLRVVGDRRARKANAGARGAIFDDRTRPSMAG